MNNNSVSTIDKKVRKEDKEQLNLTISDNFRFIIGSTIVLTSLVLATLSVLGLTVEGSGPASSISFIQNLTLFVVGYFFGTSSSSLGKDNIIKKATEGITKIRGEKKDIEIRYIENSNSSSSPPSTSKDNDLEPYQKDQKFNEAEIFE